MAGGLRVFHRAYQLWRHHGIAWPWQAGGWFLLAATPVSP
jgi:hypothetical protein